MRRCSCCCFSLFCIRKQLLWLYLLSQCVYMMFCFSILYVFLCFFSSLCCICVYALSCTDISISSSHFASSSTVWTIDYIHTILYLVCVIWWSFLLLFCIVSITLFQTDRPTNKMPTWTERDTAESKQKTIIFNRFFTIISYCGDLVASSWYFQKFFLASKMIH